MNSNWTARAARRIHKARLLLQPGVVDASGVWADLGCGDGVFTYLLSHLLQPGSHIYAVDKDAHALQQLAPNLSDYHPNVTVHLLCADFTQPLSLPPLDGLVLANALHFVPQPRALLARLVRLLKPGGRLLIIEYNARQGNAAVPYPISAHEFLELAPAVGLHDARILARAPSTFLGEMYAGGALTPSIPRATRTSP